MGYICIYTICYVQKRSMENMHVFMYELGGEEGTLSVRPVRARVGMINKQTSKHTHTRIKNEWMDEYGV